MQRGNFLSAAVAEKYRKTFPRKITDIRIHCKNKT